MSKQCPHCKNYCPDEEEICHWCGKSFTQPTNISQEISVTKVEVIIEKKGFFQTITMILLHPVIFFRQISEQGKDIKIQYTSPIRFLFLYLLLGGFINLPNISHIIMPQINLDRITLFKDFLVIIKDSFFLLLFQVLFGSLFILISILFIHFCLKIVGGKGEIKDTMRMSIYGISPSIISMIPFIGPWVVFIGTIWSTIITIIGVKILHRIGIFRVICSILIMVILFLLFAKIFIFDFMHEIYKLRGYK